jgi:hypothetical protein
MNTPIQLVGRFFHIISSGQAYLNLVYLLASFPLGVFYFVFLVSGLSTGISLVIIWIGVPILLLVGITWWMLARFERSLVITILKEDIPTMVPAAMNGTSFWSRIREYIVNPVTWKSLLYLFLKFPLGIATFVILVMLVSLTLSFLIMPIIFYYSGNFQIGLFTTPDQSLWIIDSLNDALLAAALGLFILPVTLHITNGLAWIHAKFARMMLSNFSSGELSRLGQA